MPAPCKYDQETRDRAVRLCLERRRDDGNESAIESRRRIGELLDVNPGTLRAGSNGPRWTLGSGRGLAARRTPSWSACVRRTPNCAGRMRSSRPRRLFRGGGARPRTFLVVDCIDAFKDRFGVEPICRVLSEHGTQIAPSIYYAHRSAQRVSQADWDDAQMANRLADLWRANRSLYGVEKLHAAARRGGIDIGRDQVARLMGIAGICGVNRGKHKTVTTRRDKTAGRHPDHCNRQWDTPSRPDQWWVADFQCRRRHCIYHV